MTDPFRIDIPTAISFSGGRTSGYMLWRVLQSNGGLPSDTHVLFANTGKEVEETLVFVRECGRRWNVPITWLEYRPDAPGYAVVDFNTASRNGEPFAAIIEKRNYLPNPVTRFCTVELKIRTMHKYLRHIGITEWQQFVGIRADEPRRAAKIRARPSPEVVAETMCVPLADAGVSVHDVNAFWNAQPFDLGLQTVNGRTLHGNCDLCFLKPAKQVYSLIAEEPKRAVWWAMQETKAKASGLSKGYGDRFRSDRPSYAKMQEYAISQRDMFSDDEEGIPCYCGE